MVEITPPMPLHLPAHQCPYDLIGKAPESALAVVPFL
jgi:hypothetical protein